MEAPNVGAGVPLPFIIHYQGSSSSAKTKRVGGEHQVALFLQLHIKKMLFKLGVLLLNVNQIILQTKTTSFISLIKSAVAHNMNRDGPENRFATAVACSGLIK